MNISSAPATSRRQVAQSSPPKPNKSIKAKIRLFFVVVVCAAVIWGAFFVSGMTHVSADAPISEIRSAVLGYCLDDYKSDIKPGSPIYSWNCNGTSAQNWQVVGNRIELGSKYCLSVTKNKVILENCSGAKSQQWTRYDVGFQSLANNNCLSSAMGNPIGQVLTASCNNITKEDESWTPTNWPGAPLSALSSPVCRYQTIGKRVACYANRQWLAWQTEPKFHETLIYDYSDGNPYEEWCADFVSYVYREAGAPFSNGERGSNGWDEYNANNILYMGLTYHSASSGYVPKAGDVAFFDYSGGHVEIVVSGGKHPTFIYGDSGTIDPVTGNGTMAENQIVNDGYAGRVTYYLSPN